MNQTNQKNHSADNIPQLRFPEFKDDWNKRKIEEIAIVSSGGTPNRANHKFWNGNIPWVTTSLIDFNIIDVADEFITEEGLKKSSAKLFPKGTILMAMYGQGITRGKVAMLGFEATTNQACAAIKLNEEFSTSFVFNYLAKDYLKIRNIANDGGQQNLSSGLIKTLKISFPTLPEQQKIATFLTSVDERIQLLQKQKEALEQYKKGTMQKIFSRQLRFKIEGKGGELVEPPDWQEKKLGEISKITTGSSNRQDSGLDGEFTFFDRSDDIRTSSIYLFDNEAVIIPGEGSDFIPKYFIGKFDLHQRTYAIIDFNNVLGKFIFYRIQHNRKHLLSQAVGSTVKSLRLPMFLNWSIETPSLPEQQKIASFLSAIDTQIEQVAKQIEQTQLFKKGLLQKMFI